MKSDLVELNCNWLDRIRFKFNLDYLGLLIFFINPNILFFFQLFGNFIFHKSYSWLSNVWSAKTILQFDKFSGSSNALRT